MKVRFPDPLIEEILSPWEARIGKDYLGYRGHVYRVFNFCLALRICTAEEERKLAIAVCFHDIGLWSNHTVDYLPPSAEQCRFYLDSVGQEQWAHELSLIIEHHHQIRAGKVPDFPLVEIFRRGDLVDFSLGLFSCGVPRSFIREVKQSIPNHGFHRFLLRGAGDWFLGHPFVPPPFMKW